MARSADVNHTKHHLKTERALQVKSEQETSISRQRFLYKNGFKLKQATINVNLHAYNQCFVFLKIERNINCSSACRDCIDDIIYD